MLLVVEGYSQQHLASMVKENLSKYVKFAKSTCGNKPYDIYKIMEDKVLKY